MDEINLIFTFRGTFMDKIKTSGKCFVDEYGRERIFSGVNIGIKNKPECMHGIDWSYDIAALKKRGMNIIRFFTNWSKIMPTPGTYNEKELEDIQNFLDACEKEGVYAYLDMHQDLYGDFDVEDTGGGDGAPKWASLTDGHIYIKPKLVWAEGYFINKAVHHSFDNFWSNTYTEGKGVQDHFIDMWRMLARRFGNHPALFGFDVLNEPFPGSDGGKVFFGLLKSIAKVTLTDKKIDKKKLLASLTSPAPMAEILKQYDGDVLAKITESGGKYIRKFDTERYTPFLNRVAAAIRSETDNGIIFMENCYYSNMGIPFSGGPITVNGKIEENQAFAPHAYDFMVDTPLYKYADNDRVKSIFDQRRKEQNQRLNMPVLVGEWGGGSTGTDWFHHVEFLLDLFDSYKWSNTYWCYNRGMYNSALMNVLCRPYPMAVCGSIDFYRFDREENAFELTFDQDREYDADTEIFAHRSVESVETDGTYTEEKLSDTTSILHIKTKPGKHTVKVHFAGQGVTYSANGRKPI